MSSPDQPRKKRRVDPLEGCSSHISPELLPLVSPNQVQKSSKDPNRGLYPRDKRTKNKRTLPCASFTNASKLLKESSEKNTETESEQNLPCVSFTDASKLSKKSSGKETESKRTLPCPSFTSASKLLKESSGKETESKKSFLSHLSLGEISIDVAGPSNQLPSLNENYGEDVLIEVAGSSNQLPSLNENYGEDVLIEVAGPSNEFPSLNQAYEDILIEVAGPSNQKPQELNKNHEEKDFKTSVKKYSKTPIRKSSKSKFPTASHFANKIINYFKPTLQPSVKQRVQYQTAVNEIRDGLVNNSAEGSGMLDSNSQIPGPSGSPYFRKPLDEIIENFEEPVEKKTRYYGLIEDPSDYGYDENSPSYLADLPQHILETILCQIPFVDLMKNCLVCSTWRDVISDPKFMEWKKKYYGLKKHIDVHLACMESLCLDLKINSVENCFETLLKFMCTEFNRKPSADMYELLLKNPKATQAELVLTERFPELLVKESKVWVIFATTLILSETVHDVYGVYKSLMKPNSDCSRHDVTDAFYCVATFLLYFKTEYGINHGLHYRAYTALYWIENGLPSKKTRGSQTLKIVKKLPGQQSIHSYCENSNGSLTNEQLRILNHRLQPDQIIKIIALAGTGKTTTLIHYARLYPQLKFLNVMFNKAVCEEAKKRFPPNVTCKTAHSLAYALFGNNLRFKLASRVRPHDIVPYLKYHEGSQLFVFSYARLVIATIDKFLFSTEDEIGLEHIPLSLLEIGVEYVSATDKPKILKDATAVWQKMIDPTNKQIKITHDVYLKLYQLSKPKLQGFQCIMVDEAQDCNLAMLDIVMCQDLPVILVGDPNQQIYGFRGAINALESFNPTHVFYLTKSFRFGPEIAYVASCCLEVLKSDHSNTLVGTNKRSYIDGKTEGQYAIIARTNSQLFNEAVRICCQGRLKPNEPTVIHACFAGGLKSYNFDQMVDIYKLFNHHAGPAPKIKDKFIARFRSFKDLSTYARSAEDGDLLNKVDLVIQHQSKILEYIRIMKEKCNYTIALANVIFSTAHKAKGLEFDTVCLTDDYPVVPSIDYRRRRAVDKQESNIIYVAVTRAKRCLLMPDKLMRILLAAQEKFEYPMPPSAISSSNQLECIGCSESFTPHTSLILVRRKIVAANGRTIKGGALCTKCATEPTVRPRVQIEPVVMFLDPTADYAHRSMEAFVGPLPSDPPIVRDSFGAFHEMDVVYVINLNV